MAEAAHWRPQVLALQQAVEVAVPMQQQAQVQAAHWRPQVLVPQQAPAQAAQTPQQAPAMQSAQVPPDWRYHP